ncbi:hypothetical protein P280DRAFT_151429 [Massarina eburnea CBS 473.64]|uniref:Ankyrin n=1 Tax=Massarina eburnea CBS 473.64 TaxID=1395130 RepID=A0A6A6RQE3_9PLEO|nr:hypothetical protein P280DRAFT_151429 [Massarina eburnea CBS 473.64]
MSDETHTPPANVSDTVPTSSTASTPQQSTQPSTSDKTEVHPFLLKSPLIVKPLQNWEISGRLAAMRAAISAGEDVNKLDDEAMIGFNEGRPLDACLRLGHMAGNADYRDNLPLIELLLEHGADPRLVSRAVMKPPILVAKFHAERSSGEWKEYWDRVIVLLEEAIVRLEEKGVSIEEARRISVEGIESQR